MGSINRNVYRNTNMNSTNRSSGPKLSKNSEYGYIPQRTVHEENPLGKIILQGHRRKSGRKSK